MRKYTLIAPIALCALTIAAPGAQAQSQALSASYTEHLGTRAGTHTCPDGAFACGDGTAAGFGAFADQAVFTSDGTLTRTLTFDDGSTLILNETVIETSNPGASADHQPPHAFGHPASMKLTFVVVGGSGAFAGATGSGTDSLNAAGNAAHGTLTADITA